MKISNNNGSTFCTVEEALKEYSFDTIVNYMDDEIREQVHAELAPCTEEEFIIRYLELATENLVIG